MVNKSFTTFGMSLVLAASLALWPQQSSFTSGLAQTASPAIEALSAFADRTTVPDILSERDVTRYRALFAAQEQADWEKADTIAGTLHNPILMGHALAERYLHPKYKSKPEELTAWLTDYSDHPEAYAIYRLAVAKSPATREALEHIRKPSALSGFGTDRGADLRFPATGTGVLWRSGLEAWRASKPEHAAKSFVRLSENDRLTPWQSSAASYWAWRSLVALDRKSEAEAYLLRAAENKYSFYGLLARKQLNMPLDVDSGAIALSETEVLTMLHEPLVRRVVAYTQLGMNDDAERELRVAFPVASDQNKLRLLALAHQRQLASVQILMARQLEKGDLSIDAALYPVPDWQPQDGFKIDPALIYALARQESGFSTAATSPMGASGIMQLMPKTASMMQKSMNIGDEYSLSDPSFNMTLGQNYVMHLLDNTLVDGNLVYMLSAYNAGPARLMEWKKRIGRDDPLLFIESIPYGETRAYVMQVMTNYWIYSELSGGDNLTLAMLAKNHWPSYRPDVPLAQAGATGTNG